jgi:hypothetical protein
VQAAGDPHHIFQYWYRRYREQDQAPPGDSGFARLTVTAPTSTYCEVIFTDGTKIVFREPVAVQYLKSLLF